ncbi:serine/threonine-protein kinase [Nonomuraea sp. NPDC050786]|uniref:serine/threonine-protein kinase n=1 Tax=Nonomuraea sp. NPDC050786 TaxID=3154840 RepID=UPI0033F62FD1
MTSEPQRIGPYTIIRSLGEGGMGIVHLARDENHRLVALKTLREGPAMDAGFRRRFTREVEAARSVARFCTAPVLDAGIDGETAYIVTEYVDGPDLAAAIRDGGPMAGANLEALAVGVATALAAIHQAGVVHRDLKPGNILLSPVGPRVIDFGIAQLATPDATRSVGIVGTPAYMSPEQAVGGEVTAASDVFAWGGVVAYAATGRPPFGAGGAPETLFRVVHYAPELEGLDERLRPLVEQALAKEPARRPTAQQLLDRLLGRESATAETAIQAVNDSWTAPSAPEPSGRRWKAPVAIAAALLVAGGTLAATWRPWEAGAVPVPSGGRPSQQAAAGPGQRDTFVTNLDGRRVPVHVTIDSLTRNGDEVLLYLWVRNDSPQSDPVDQWTFLGKEAEDLRGISLTPEGSSRPLRPRVKSDVCSCSSWYYSNSVLVGSSQLFYANFRGIPESAEKADIDLLELGRFSSIPITS